MQSYKIFSCRNGRVMRFGVETNWTEQDLLLMQRALEQASAAALTGEVPVGALVTDSAGQVLAEAGNACIRNHDPSAHAEMLAIRAAAALMGNYRLPGCRLYVTLEPCVMCAGLCIQARIGTIVYGAADPKAGALHSCYKIGSDGQLNHAPIVRGGLLAREASDLLVGFFRARR